VVGQGFKQLSDVFKEAADGDSIKLCMAVSQASFTMDDMAKLWKEQPNHDQRPWIDGLTEYGSMLTQFGDAVQSSKEAESRVQHMRSRLRPDMEAADKEKVETVRFARIRVNRPFYKFEKHCVEQNELPFFAHDSPPVRSCCMARRE